MNDPIFSLLYTSRRPLRVLEVVEKWARMAAGRGDIEFVFTCDRDDKLSRGAMIAAAAFLQQKNIKSSGPFPSEIPGTCVKGWNLAASYSKGDILIAISDDFVPPDCWDRKLLIEITNAGKGPQDDFAVQVSDGYIPPTINILTLPIVSRAYYGRVGYLLHPSYESMFVDNDLAEHAVKDGKMIQARALVFQHQHYAVGKRERDRVDAVHASQVRFDQGRRIYEARKSLGFPIDRGPCGLRNENIPDAWIAYIQAIRDDFCLTEVCLRLEEQGVKDFFFSVPNQDWRGKMQDGTGLEEIRTVANLLATLDCSCYIQQVDVSKFRGNGNRLIIDVETRVRNSALEEIQSMGYGHVLIADADEIWRPGLFDKIKRTVSEGAVSSPDYISCDNVPVIKGLPVHDAKDRVGIYIRADNRFLYCRGPYRMGMTVHYDSPWLYHFTATRRTEAEVFAKMRASGHYDDPDYSFENWINTTWPAIAPGYRNAHMYRRGQNIWPEVREWQESAINELPITLRPYLWLK